MFALILNLLLFSLPGNGFAMPASAHSSGNDFNLQRFTIDLSHGVPRMIELVKSSILPKNTEYLNLPAGTDLGTLRSLREEWVTDFDWEKEQKSMNRLNHFTVEIDNLTIHFIHEKSNRTNSFPLLLNHGWPGSFLEFFPLIEHLKSDFDIIIPSLPGFAFSSVPKANWTTADTSRVFNTLMTKVLGYPKYAIHGTDWGSSVAYNLYANYNTSVRASHFSFLPFYPLNETQLAALGVSLSPLEQFEAQRFETWASEGDGYFAEQSTQPKSIGFALYDNPIGLLSWVGGKFIEWSDPRAGTLPSVLNHNEILKSVSLYYLTNSIISSMFIYYQNPTGFGTTYEKPPTDAPMLYSAFKYNVGFYPPYLVSKIGNLVYYKNHEFGGHFPGTDNPPALAEDLKEIKRYWSV